MKYKDCLLWLLLPLAVDTATRVQAGMVINPSEGLSVTTFYGSTNDGPPGVIAQTSEASLNGSILGDTDPRSMQGFDVASYLLYNLKGLSGTAPSQAILTLPLDSVLQNFDPSFSWYTDLYITISGAKANTLNAGDIGTTSGFENDFSIPTGSYAGTPALTLDVTATIQGLVTQGFDYATILFQTYDSTVAGPSLVTFTQAPTLNLTSSGGNDPGGQAVPEPSSIFLVGISAAGLLLRGLIGPRRT